MAKDGKHKTSTRLTQGDAPLLDLNDASIKKMMARAESAAPSPIDEIDAVHPQPTRTR